MNRYSKLIKALRDARPFLDTLAGMVPTQMAKDNIDRHIKAIDEALAAPAPMDELQQLADARVKIERKLVETNWGSIARKLWPEYGPLGIKGRADRTREMVREALATPAPKMGQINKLGGEPSDG